MRKQPQSSELTGFKVFMFSHLGSERIWGGMSAETWELLFDFPMTPLMKYFHLTAFS